jgi:hypothetical protein
MTIRALSPTEIRRLVQALETRYRPVLLLAVTTGLGFRTAHVALYATPKKTARDDAKEITASPAAR